VCVDWPIEALYKDKGGIDLVEVTEPLPILEQRVCPWHFQDALIEGLFCVPPYINARGRRHEFYKHVPLTTPINLPSAAWLMLVSVAMLRLVSRGRA
jgi:hypothetical protein